MSDTQNSTQSAATGNSDGKPRPLKVLHIGNIANNGFIASRLLNERGIESHLLVADYYHTHGCPEWEDAEIEGDWGDDFFPGWHRTNLHGYKRPDWIAQGPRHMAIQYLIALNEGKHRKAAILRRLLARYRRMISSGRIGMFGHRLWNSRFGMIFRGLSGLDHPGAAQQTKAEFPGAEWVNTNRASSRLASLIPAAQQPVMSDVERGDIYRRLSEAKATLRSLRLGTPNPDPKLGPEIDHEAVNAWDKIVRDLTAIVKPPKLSDEVHHYDYDAHLWRRLFSHYDVVVGYATDGIWPMAVGKSYFALEHGTIRNLPFEQSYIGRQTKAVYQNAAGVFVTNCDNNRAADKMGLKNYVFIPHPTMEDNIDVQREKAARLRQMMEARFDCDFIVFNPSRHHWDKGHRDSNWDKGNDLMIEGFARLVNVHKVRGLLILVEAGQMIQKSKELIAELGIGSRVMWMKSQPHRSFMRYIMASDVVADQFGPPLSFGGIPPKAMQCERPILTNYNSKLHTWCFDELPPFIITNNYVEIGDTMADLYRDPERRAAVGKAGKEWYKKYYSNDVFYQTLNRMVTKAYGKNLDGTPAQ